VFGLIVVCGFEGFDLNLSVDQYVGTDILLWTGLLGPIIECGVLCVTDN